MTNKYFRQLLFSYHKHLFLDSWKILDECAAVGYDRILFFAVDSGASVDYRLLKAAAQHGRLEIVKYLLSKMDKHYIETKVRINAEELTNEAIKNGHEVRFALLKSF